MKKLIFILTFAFVLGGCSNSVSVSPSDVAKRYSGNFSSKATVVFGENNAEIEIEKNPMSISVSVISPKDAAGLSVEISAEHAKVRYNGTEQDIDPEKLPSGAVFLLVENLFDGLGDAEEFDLSTEKEKINVLSEDFSAVLSSENLSLISTDFPEHKTRFEFSEFVFDDPQ